MPASHHVLGAPGIRAGALAAAAILGTWTGATGPVVLAGTPAGAAPPAGSATVLAAAPTGTGTACTPAAPCALPTALTLAGAAGDATIDLGAGTYTASGGFQLVLGAPAGGGPAAVSLQGASGGSVLDGGGTAPVLSLAGAGTVTVEDLTFQHGASPGSGGGIADAGGPSVSVADAAFLDDRAANDGGGIAVSGAAGLSVTGSTFVGDTAGGRGGGIAETSTPTTVVGSTLVGDTAGSGGGIAGDASAQLAADVLGDDGGGACAGPLQDAGYVVADDTTCPGGTGSVVVPGSTLFPGGTPAPASLGGPVQVVPLAVRADPALTAVPAAAVLAGSSTPFCSTTDARGEPRRQVAVGGRSLATGCAAGAFQVALPTVDQVTPTAPVPGTLVTLHGTGLGLVTGVTLDGSSVGFHVGGDTALTFTLPAGLHPGEAAIEVTSPDTTLPGAAPGTAKVEVAGPLAISTRHLGYTETGAVFVQGLFAAGGAGGYRWSVTGALPPGIHVSPTGVVSGIPTTPGSFPLAVTVTDRTGAQVHETLVLTVGAGPQITTTSLPAAQVDQPYRVHLLATGGRGPYHWSVPSSISPFPGGLLLSSRGILSGIPGQEGAMPVRFLVTDAAGGRASVTLELHILPPPAPPPPPQAYVVAAASGLVTPFGTPSLPARTTRVHGRVAGVALPPSGGGYWVVTTTGAVEGTGNLHSLGSVGPRYLRGRIVGIASTPTGDGYWVASSTGQVYGFGAAHALGSPAAQAAARARLGRVVAIVAAPSGTGYWLVGDTGQVAAFGDAASLGSIPRWRRIHVAAAAADPSGAGYVLVSSAGRLFGFGTDRPLGYATRARPGRFVGVASAPNGLGVWLVTTKGRVVSLGSAEAFASIYAFLPGGAVGIASGR